MFSFYFLGSVLALDLTFGSLFDEFGFVSTPIIFVPAFQLNIYEEDPALPEEQGLRTGVCRLTSFLTFSHCFHISHFFFFY